MYKNQHKILALFDIDRKVTSQFILNSYKVKTNFTVYSK